MFTANRITKIDMVMLQKFSTLALLLVAITGTSTLVPVSGELAADETELAGLVVQWQSQVMVDGAREGVAEIHVHVHDDRAVSYYELRYPGFRKTIAFDDLNPRGVPFSQLYPENPGQGAKEWAELTKEILEAKGKKDISMELITVPQTTIYALSDSGGVHAIDAETGQTRWKTRVGTHLQPTIGLASNNTRVIAVRGSRIHCLDAMTGEEVWSRLTRFAPGGGVSVSDNYAYVTSINGRLQMFPLNENGLPEAFFASSGPATFDPVVTANTVSWATERGYFNVARSDVVSLRYRLETDDEFRAAGAAVGDKLVVNSTRGNVYAMNEQMGTLDWEFAVGERLDRSPIAIGREAVMLITASSQLVVLDARKGGIMDGWPKRISGIAEYVGASQNIVYFIKTNGQLVGLNRATGATVSSVSIPGNSMAVPNPVTDRLYVAQPNGMLQCLREIANVNPVVRGEDFVVGNAAAEENRKKAGLEMDPNKTAPQPIEEKPAEESADPFDGADPADPFENAGGGEDESDDGDPFEG